MAREFGFCYGVERAVEYAYQTRHKFPERRVVLVGEIIHNPHVNERMREMGISILEPRLAPPPDEPRFDYSAITPDDVVLLRFGVPMAAFNALRGSGAVVIRPAARLPVWKEWSLPRDY